MKEPKLCKCGHTLIEDHKKQSNLFGLKFKVMTHCKQCWCFEYVERTFPTKEDPLFVLGILNSMLARFFMVFLIYNRSRLTMHADKSYVGRLPIPNVDDSLK